jgi:hypothetical protein
VSRRPDRIRDSASTATATATQTNASVDSSRDIACEAWPVPGAISTAGDGVE